MVNTKNKYFGTDGFRGEAGVGLTAMHAYKIGRFLGWFYASPLSGCMEAVYRPRALLGKDTRISGDMLESAFSAGLCASGADVYKMNVTTTPCVAHTVRQDGFDFGVMITASHNPFSDNGIKIIERSGEKMNDKTTALIEAYLDGDVKSLGVRGELPYASGKMIGREIDYSAACGRYVRHIASLARGCYKGMRIGLDCANGASYKAAGELFGLLGAELELIGAEPDGVNINKNCGSTHTERLRKLIAEKRLDAGFAFDGDGDRCIAIDENGAEADGDKMLYILAKSMKARGELCGNTAVATVMSNSGLARALEHEGIKLCQTSVGDRFVYECMQKNGYVLGGEKSGHIIFRNHATTGDGLLSALMILEEMQRSGEKLSSLAAPVHFYPQYDLSVRVKDKSAVLCDPAVLAAVQKAECEINGKGRVLIRESGTEALVRIMAECESEKACRAHAEAIADVISERGWCNG